MPIKYPLGRRGPLCAKRRTLWFANMLIMNSLLRSSESNMLNSEKCGFFDTLFARFCENESSQGNHLTHSPIYSSVSLFAKRLATLMGIERNSLTILHERTTRYVDLLHIHTPHKKSIRLCFAFICYGKMSKSVASRFVVRILKALFRFVY
jgi:hypothetical protein